MRIIHLGMIFWLVHIRNLSPEIRGINKMKNYSNRKF